MKGQLLIDTVLEADGLRDDFYCSPLAYSINANILAVGLNAKLYLWSQKFGLIHPPSSVNETPQRYAWITSLAFSSEEGGKAILAIGRADGRLLLFSIRDEQALVMRLTLPYSVSYLSFRPTVLTHQSRLSLNRRTDHELLAVGDERGNVYIFLIEWPSSLQRDLFDFPGALTLKLKMTVHQQQICGIAWSPDGAFFATGGNDNLCCLFQLSRLLDQGADQATLSFPLFPNADGEWAPRAPPEHRFKVVRGREVALQRWRLAAAVKAVAFCPWQKGLLAAGGGSNDRRIHFYNTVTGVCLATIQCFAQVTSLIWSTTRRQIAATLGFPQPEHAYRIVVFAWPSCEQLAAVSWQEDMRALYAIPYPRGPGSEHHGQRHRHSECIIVAGSDRTIKFHEVFPPIGAQIGGKSKRQLEQGSLLEISQKLEDVWDGQIR